MADSTSKRSILARLRAIERIISEELAAEAGRDRLSAGLAAEGFVGGYLAALYDVEAALTHGCPSDQRGYWRRAEGVSR